ncbi:MAG TPA: winged helix DNA-binding domain-containing protein [Candidatus Limnocylindrales bacterium]|nr:winged helix DNA-binding domain-containing protein [Candidatus Limnocylindrales bacterium]
MGGPVDAVRHLLAVQSQDYPGAVWALGQRIGSGTAASIGTEFDDGAFIRTHVLRPTWHFVAPEDLRWLVALTAPRLIRGAAHRHRALGIDARLLVRAAGVFERQIAERGPQTRPELGAALARSGIEAEAGRLMHLIMWAEYEAILCSGPRKAKLQSYVLLEERVAPARPREREEAIVEIAARYVAGHGPVQDVDLAWWSGGSLGEARRGLQGAGDRLERTVMRDGRIFWSADDGGARAAGATGRSVHLLPNYDELLVAMRDRTDCAHPDLPEDARRPEHIFNDVIVVDGQVVGEWDRPTPSGKPRLGLRPRVKLDAGTRADVEAAANLYGRFIDRRLTVEWLD